MIYAASGAARYKASMEPGPIVPPNAPRNTATIDLPARDTFSTQTPLVVIGLAAIGMIFLINSHARPTPTRENVVVLFVLGMRNRDVGAERTRTRRSRSSSRFRCWTARCA